VKIPIYQVDAFTDQPFQGNPAAVVILEKTQPAQWMQLVAREMNLSETAFVYRQENGYKLQWFTPRTEIELCGHATLATAHVLWESGRETPEARIRFSTRSGWLSAEKKQGIIELDFPAAGSKTGDLTEELIAAIGSVPESVHISGEKWLLEYPDEADIVNMKPDFGKLIKFSGRGLIVTSRSERPGIDFVSRYFAPWVGVNEDPVTGSAHCILGPYWGEKLGKNHLMGRQLSARGGTVHVRLSGERVYIGGQAVTIFHGEMDNLD
jgi:PhzF family phenazine biosynthesis protein